MEWGKEIANNIEKQIEMKKMVAKAFEKAIDEIQQALKETESLKDEITRYYYDVNKGEYRIMAIGQSYNYNFEDIKGAIREAAKKDFTINITESNAIAFRDIAQEQVDKAVKKLIFKDLVDNDIV